MTPLPPSSICRYPTSYRVLSTGPEKPTPHPNLAPLRSGKENSLATTKKAAWSKSQNSRCRCVCDSTPVEVDWKTVDGSEIPNNHLECIKPGKSWDNLPINWCRISSINKNHTSFSSKDTLRIPIFVVLKGKQLGENAWNVSYEDLRKVDSPNKKSRYPSPRELNKEALRYLAKPKSVNLIWPVLGNSTRGAKTKGIFLAQQFVSTDC